MSTLEEVRAANWNQSAERSKEQPGAPLPYGVQPSMASDRPDFSSVGSRPLPPLPDGAIPPEMSQIDKRRFVFTKPTPQSKIFDQLKKIPHLARLCQNSEGTGTVWKIAETIMKEGISVEEQRRALETYERSSGARNAARKMG